MKYLAVTLMLLVGCSGVEQPLAGDDPVRAFFLGTPGAKAFSGPNGRKGYSIECAGGVWAAECFNAAARVCDGDYEVLSRGEVDDLAIIDVLCGVSRPQK